MATSLVLMASDKNKTMKPPPALLCGSSEEDPPKTEPSRSGRGRKANNNGKGQNQKKQPQRGMGVAQLENILRAQEMNDQIHRSSSSSSSSSSVITPLLSPSVPVVNDPFAGNLPPSRRAPPTNHGPLHHRPPPPPPPPLMFNGNVVIPGGSGHGRGPTSNNNAAFNNVLGGGFGAPSWSPLVGFPLETSRELSSIPNPHPESQPCDLCFKKKRFADDNILRGSNTRRDSSALDIWSMIQSPDHFLGFPLQQIPNLTAESTDFIPKMSTHNAYSYRNLDESVGVVAVHRKIGTMRGKILKEYEFFPGKDHEDAERGTTFKELGLSLVGGGYEATSSSSITATASARARIINADTTTTVSANSNSVDLSLRL